MHLHENHSQGHNASADLWALGILVYELLSGRYERGAGHRAPFRALRPCAYENRPPQRRRTPFASSDVMNTYNLILMGFGQHECDVRVEGDAKDLVLGLCR